MIKYNKRSILKRISRWIGALCFIILLERFIRLQTHGFRIEKVYFDECSFSKDILSSQHSDNELLSQSFYFLGSGVQCYVFLGEDQKTVLKLFKHYHGWPSSSHLKKIPLPHFLYSWRENILRKRKERITSIYKSVFLATQLCENTGVLHAHLQPTHGQYPRIKLFDKIGVIYHLSLDNAAFVLQKKAEPLGEYLQKYPEQRREILTSFLDCILFRYGEKIINTDSVFFRNFGVCNRKVIEIDIGSFCKNPYLANPKISKKELFYETLPLTLWLKKHAQEDFIFFEEEMNKVLLQ